MGKALISTEVIKKQRKEEKEEKRTEQRHGVKGNIFTTRILFKYVGLSFIVKLVKNT